MCMHMWIQRENHAFALQPDVYNYPTRIEFPGWSFKCMNAPWSLSPATRISLDGVPMLPVCQRSVHMWWFLWESLWEAVRVKRHGPPCHALSICSLCLRGGGCGQCEKSPQMRLSKMPSYTKEQITLSIWWPLWVNKIQSGDEDLRQMGHGAWGLLSEKTRIAGAARSKTGTGAPVSSNRDQQRSRVTKLLITASPQV